MDSKRALIVCEFVFVQMGPTDVYTHTLLRQKEKLKCG